MVGTGAVSFGPRTVCINLYSIGIEGAGLLVAMLVVAGAMVSLQGSLSGCQSLQSPSAVDGQEVNVGVGKHWVVGQLCSN